MADGTWPAQAIAEMELEVAERQMKHDAMHLIKTRLDAIVQLESKIRAAEQEQLVAALEKSVVAHFQGQKVCYLTPAAKLRKLSG
jgi:hypothetical protein